MLSKLGAVFAVAIAMAVLPASASAVGSIAFDAPTAGGQYSASTLPAKVLFTTFGTVVGSTDCQLSINGNPPGFAPCATAPGFIATSIEISPTEFDWSSGYGGTAGSSPDGTWVFSARANLDGNVVTGTRSFTVDTVAPQLSWTAPTEDQIFAVNVPSIAAEPADPSPGTGVAEFDCRYDANPFVDCNDASISNPGLLDGAHTMSMRATDVVGNTTTEVRSFRIDTVVPVVTLVDVASPSNDDSPMFSFAADDLHPGLSECRVYLFGTTAPAFGPCTSSLSFAPGPLADGQWVAQIRHTDEAGNPGFDSDSFVVDTVEPVITIASPQPNQVLETSIPELDFKADDPDPGTGVASFQCAFDADALLLCGDDGFANRRLADGAHSLTTRATDNAGNVASKVVQFSVDSSLGNGNGGPKPTKAVFKRLSAKVKGGKLNLRVRATLTLPSGVDASAACSGKIRLALRGKLKSQRAKKFTKRLALKRVGGACVLKTTFKLPRAYKGRRFSVTATHPGNAQLGAYKLTGRV